MSLPALSDRRGFLLGKHTIAGNRLVRPAAAIARSCLAFRGVACMSCRDACLTGTIRFSLACGGAVPHVETEACTGCADCLPVCRVSAVTLAVPEASEPTHA
jgi:ferredoxin-type protein NapF